jgi:hypothetical protein
MAIAMKKSTLAIPLKSAATPLNPKNPATSEIRKKIKAHFSIENFPQGKGCAITGAGRVSMNSPIPQVNGD